jgi:excisionase family DNA binding protein
MMPKTGVSSSQGYSIYRRRLQLSEVKVYTVEQVAEQLKINPRTVYRLIEIGQLHGVKVGRQWRITAEALNTFLQLPADQQSLNAQLFHVK